MTQARRGVVTSSSSNVYDRTIVWIVSVHVEYIYKEMIVLNKFANVDKFKAILAVKYADNQTSKKPNIGYVPFDVF